MAMTFLPRFLVLKSGGKYLTVPENLHESLPSGFLKCDEEQIWSPRVKFAVEQAQTGDGRLVNIRSCYNNKYWVVDPIQQLLRIVAAGDKPEEDQSKDSCTLFEPNFTSSGNGTVRLRHVQTAKTLINKSLGPFVSSSMFQGVEVSLSGTGTLFDIIDWETLVILPSQIVFRSEELDGNYICSFTEQQQQYQAFESGMDVGDPLLAKDLSPTPDGNYRIKDMYYEKFWKYSSDTNIEQDQTQTKIWNPIFADGEDSNNSDNDTIFSIVKVSDNVIALRNLGSNKFCGAKRGGRTTKFTLMTGYPNMSRHTRLIVEERVLQREISDVRYRQSDSRIYDVEMQEVSHAIATNYSREHESKVTLTYKTSDSRTTQWTNSLSISIGASVTFTTNIIPFIESGEVQLSVGACYSHEWRDSETTEHTREASYTVVVPPLKTIKVTLMCSKGKCDVPFSYIQRDLLPTGKRVTTPKEDGIYTGINSYDFHFKSSEVTEDAQGRTFI